MANDISSINGNRPQQAARDMAERVKSEARSDSMNAEQNRGADSGSDRVSLTDTASKLKDIERSIGDDAAVNQSRVNQVKDALARGEYKVDADRVADKMIDFETSLRR